MPMPVCDFCPDDQKFEARIIQTDMADGEVTNVCPNCLPDFAIALTASILGIDPGQIIGLVQAENDASAAQNGSGSTETKPKGSRSRKKAAPTTKPSAPILEAALADDDESTEAVEPDLADA